MFAKLTLNKQLLSPFSLIIVITLKKGFNWSDNYYLAILKIINEIVKVNELWLVFLR